MKRLKSVIHRGLFVLFLLTFSITTRAVEFPSGNYVATFMLAPINVAGTFPCVVSLAAKTGMTTLPGTIQLAFTSNSKSLLSGTLAIGFDTYTLTGKQTASSKSFQLSLAGTSGASTVKFSVKLNSKLAGKLLTGSISGKGGTLNGKGTIAIDYSAAVPLEATLTAALTNNNGAITGTGTATVNTVANALTASGKETSGKSGPSVSLALSGSLLKFSGSGIVAIPDDDGPSGVEAVYKAKGFGASASGKLTLGAKTTGTTTGNSLGSIVLADSSATHFTASTGVVLFNVIGTSLLPGQSTVTATAGGTAIPASQIQFTENQIAISTTLFSDMTVFNVSATDLFGLTVAGTGTVWSGSFVLTVNVVDQQGQAVKGALVTATLGDDHSIMGQGTSDAAGNVVFENLPDRTILLMASVPGTDKVGTNANNGGAGTITVVILDFNTASTVVNNDISLGTSGWDTGTSPVTVIPHTESGGGTPPPSVRAVDQDLQLTTSGEGPQFLSRTFVTQKDTKSVSCRYRFITSEIPGGYFGTQYNDYFAVLIRSSSGGGLAFEINTMNALGLAAFDASGATAWRKVKLPVAVAGDTVQVDVIVANVADGYLDSQVVVDKIIEERVELKVAKPLVKLLDTNTFTVNVTSSGTVANYVIEIRRASEATWYTLASAQMLDNYTESVAGKFKVRGKADIDGTTEMSPEVDLEVQFPSYADIVGDAGVKAHCDAAWADTKAAATATKRHEEAFYILLNTTGPTTGYTFTATKLGPDIGPLQTGSVVPDAKPDDVPATPTPIASATYTVALFHTHTPTFYRPVGRAVGPSGADQNAITGYYKLVGVVYDYVGDASGNAPSHWPLNSPAQLWPTGLNRRATPP
ncbi:MAG TPA: hypothetical protein VKX17_25075 [Planctomycetota bacterium]|nr:hypothetical protein [Planctomycetota bacterium]